MRYFAEPETFYDSSNDSDGQDRATSTLALELTDSNSHADDVNVVRAFSSPVVDDSNSMTFVVSGSDDNSWAITRIVIHS